MDIARAMFLGGKIVYANDCDVSSYLELGLRCSVCREPVYLKTGKIRKPHFAHFKGTDSRLVEECKLRAAAYGNYTENIDFIEDREQRLEIFQKHFLKMIFLDGNKIVDDSKFKNWIHSVKWTHNQLINNITKACTEYFLIHQQSMQDKYILTQTEIIDKQILLKQEIALEAINYLCVKSSGSLLEYIIHYSVYKLYNQSQEYNILKQLLIEENLNKICLFIIEIIILNPWTKAFCNAKNINLSIVDTSQLSIPEQTQQKAPSQLQMFLAQVQNGVKGKPINSSNINASQLTRLERDKLINQFPLYYILPALRYGARGGTKKIDIKCQVRTIINSDENTAIQFSFMVNEYIKADSRFKNADGKYMKCEIEVWNPALVYKFSPNFSLSVEPHHEMLFPYGGYIFDFPEIKTRCELANLFNALISYGQIEYIKTREDNNKLSITSASDCSILVLYELLKHCHIIPNTRLNAKNKYEEIEFKTVMRCMINAAKKAVESGVPLIEGMLLHSLSTAAKRQIS